MDEMLREEKFAAELEGYRGAPAQAPNAAAGGAAAASDSGAGSAEAAGPESGQGPARIASPWAYQKMVVQAWAASKTLVRLPLTLPASLAAQKGPQPSSSRPSTS